jgi:iron complex outermembrane receptor protein
MSPRLFIPALLACAAFCQTPDSSSATSHTDASDPFHIKTTVVVTATRGETEIDQAPVSTSLITRDEIEIRNIQAMDQALNLAEGVYPIRGKGVSDTLVGVGMRGFSGRGAAQSRVLVLLDGQPVNDAYTGGVAWTPLPPNEMERVEVARGPFSALYGGNAMGGVVNMMTRTYDRRTLQLEGEYGTHDTVIYSGRYSDQFFNRLNLTFGYRRLQSQGYQNYPVLRTAKASDISAGTPVTGVKQWMTSTGGTTYQMGWRGQNGWNQHSYRGRAQYTFNSRTAASVQVFHLRSQYGYDTGTSTIRDADGQPVYAGSVVFQMGDQWLRSTLTEYRFLNGPGGGESYFAQGQLHHEFQDRSRLQLVFGLLDSPSDWYVTPDSSSDFSGGTGKIADRPNRGYYGSAQVNLRSTGRHRLVFGAETRHNSTDGGEYSLANYAFRGQRSGLLTAAKGSAFNQALYIQDQVSATSRLQLVLGGRYDYWRSYDGLSAPAPGEESIAYPARSSNSFNGKISARYQLTESTSAYGNLGTAFRNPTVFELFRTYRLSSGNLYVANPELDPEKLFSWEVGLRQRFFGRLEINASFFENYIDDLIYRTTDLETDPTGKTRPLVNAAEGFTRGLEGGATLRINEWLRYRMTYTYNNAIIERSPELPTTEGKRVPYVPKHMGSFGLLGSKNGWSGSVTGRYVGSAYRTDTNTDVVRGVPGSYNPFFELDATIGYDIKQRVTIYATFSNLLDREYYMYYLNPGRTASIGLRFNVL